jgi:hypothetical protein
MYINYMMLGLLECQAGVSIIGPTDLNPTRSDMIPKKNELDMSLIFLIRINWV